VTTAAEADTMDRHDYSELLVLIQSLEDQGKITGGDANFLDDLYVEEDSRLIAAYVEHSKGGDFYACICALLPPRQLVSVQAPKFDLRPQSSCSTNSIELSVSPARVRNLKLRADSSGTTPDTVTAGSHVDLAVEKPT
jgi:hypothetical protein